MKALISAGGFGTRIRSASANVPKPMIKVDGVPVLERTILQLKKYGICDLIFTVSYLKEQIMEYFGNGESFGVNIKYFEEDEPLGSAGALFKLKNEFADDFLVLNGDIIFDVDLNKMIEYHTKNDALITLFAHPNTHPYDSTLICYDKNNVVCNLFKGKNRPKYYKNCVNAGIHILNPKVFDRLSNNGDEVKNFDKDLIIPALKTKKVFAYLSSEYVKDMGTPDRLIAVTEDVKSGKVEKKNIKNKQKAIFLDRDGTINKYVGFLSDINDFELIDNVAEAIKDINKSDFLAIVITNQPVIARGEVTFKELEEIHKKMETLLGEKGAYVDAIYYCPHHPDKGFEGEVTELKIDCNCRKPKPGMLLKAADEFNIDLSKSYMIGDSDADIKTAENAGCRSIKIECAEEFWKKFNIHEL
ncbi:D-glycero-beta-D-manno-heptose 1,7-bisphosphate 7-phosphatase [Eubacterium sp.]